MEVTVFYILVYFEQYLLYQYKVLMIFFDLLEEVYQIFCILKGYIPPLVLFRYIHFLFEI